MTEPLPADIAAAIADLVYASHRDGAIAREKPAAVPVCLVATAVAALNVAILAHLRKADELQAALERVASGGA